MLMFQPYTIPFSNKVVSFFIELYWQSSQNSLSRIVHNYHLELVYMDLLDPSPIGYLQMVFYIMQLLLMLFPNLPRFILRKYLISLLFFTNSSL